MHPFLLCNVSFGFIIETGKGYHGKLSTLLQWHIEDPVDSFEINRNDVIYRYQENRNPYIDHPEYVDKIWNTATGTGFIHQSDGIRIYPNPAKEYIVIKSTDGELVNGRIYSVSGVNVTEFKCIGSTIIQTAKLNSGIYLIQINSHQKIINFKISVIQ